MDYHYPPGPEAVPESLTKATATYRLHAWLAMIGLLVFVLFYLALTVWFCWTTYRLIAPVFDGKAVLLNSWILAVCSGFLAVFMLKALFFVKQGKGESVDIEVTPEEEPALFEFLNRLADEAGAPRPYRVFLSPRVNAAVYYDLSLLNLIFPSRKNLEIGLGLVNVLSVGELKAVLAHEFGHFGQKSMAVGRWVYVAQQIAAHIVAKRDILDRFLQGLSRIDIRLAWVGWLMTLIVWSIRALLETVFSLVVMAQRALSREMEFQADLVAVSLTGSDALIQALHCLSAADDAWDRAISFAGSEAENKRAVKDVFALQSRILEQIARVTDTPDYGKSPEIPEQNREAFRVFTAEIAQPPKMWATHPHNHEREENAKRCYLPSPDVAESAWQMFADSEMTRTKMTQAILASIEDARLQTIEDSLKRLDERYQYEYLNKRYRGAYLDRSIVRHVKDVDELYERYQSFDVSQLKEVYPDSLVDDLEALRNLEREKALLEALRDGFLKAPGGVIRHRGQILKKRELPGAIEEVRLELEDIQKKLAVYDRRVRTLHYMAARQIGSGWDEYLKSILSLLHYADHSASNIVDAKGFLSNVVAVILADGNVSRAELRRLLRACTEVRGVLWKLFDHKHEVRLTPQMLDELEVKSWSELLGDFDLPDANENNVNQWMQAIDGWLDGLAAIFGRLRHMALEELLKREAFVAAHVISGQPPKEKCPLCVQVPASYALLKIGDERKLQKKLGLWDRFQTADGVFASIMRFLVSGSIVGATLVFSAVIK